MNYSKEEVIQYALEEDVKFIRIAFCDVFGTQKNISIMPEELPRAFEYGIPFDASAIAGFGSGARCDLMLHPEPGTLAPLPWRPEHGRVVQMFSTISRPDGTAFSADTRSLLKSAVQKAGECGYEFTFSTGQDFYLFLLDENGEPTGIPCDRAGYMDIAPEDHGENVRREVCLTLEQMGIRAECSHHEAGPGQNLIDLGCADPLKAADNAMTFQRVVKTIAHRNGLCADFGPKPVASKPGNGFHISMSLKGDGGKEALNMAAAGILKNLRAMTLFLDPSDASYLRLNKDKVPDYISWSACDRHQPMRITDTYNGITRVQMRSPDPGANPYLALALMIFGGLYGIENSLTLPPPAGKPRTEGNGETASPAEKLPESYGEACRVASSSEFIETHIPKELLDIYCSR